MAIPVDDKRTYLSRRLEFVNMSTEVNKILKEFDVKLNFAGFTETFNDYINFEAMETSIIHGLIRELSEWIKYMSDIESIIKYYSNYFLVLSESTDDLKLSNDAHRKHFLLKNYLKSLQSYKKRFRNSRKDCVEKLKESYNAFYREM
jgi:hypothetical protein